MFNGQSATPRRQGNYGDVAKDDAKSEWKTKDDQEQIDRFGDEALAAKTRAIALIAADVARSTTRVNQQRAFDNENSAAYLQTMTAWENIDAVYRQYEANSFASSAANLASYNGSPWADYDADQAAATTANVTATTNGHRTNDIDTADAQSTAEIAQTNASGNWEIAQLTARGTLAAVMANVSYTIALAQSTTISADDDEMRVPTVPLATDLDGLYDVAKPGNDYVTSVSSVSTNTYAHYYSGYWWGAWGYYGSGYWYSSYYGYGYPYQSYFSSASHVSLSQPSKQFPDSFWKVHDDVDEISFDLGGVFVQSRYDTFDLSSNLFTTEKAPAVKELNSSITAIQQSQTPPTPVAYDAQKVLDILETIDPDLAEFWRTRGRLTHAPVGTRAIADVQLNYKTKRELDPTNINASSSYFDESIAVENYAISIPNDWESARVAKLIHDAANGLVEEEEFDRIHDGFKQYLATLEPEFNQGELNDAKNNELLAAYGDVALQEFGMAELNAENVPNERIEHLLKTGQAEMFTEYIGRTPYHAVAMWIPMADGTFRSLIFEYVNAGWTSSGHWRLKSLGPGKQYGPGGSWDLRELVDAYIFDGKRVDQAESIASKAEFVLHFIPLGAAADYASQGEFGEAALSVAGDAAMLLTGGGSKAIGSLASGVRAAKLTNGLRATGIVTEGTIAGIRGWQGGVKLANGDGGYGEIAEALLRVFGMKYALSTKVDDLARAGKSAARSPKGNFTGSGVADDVDAAAEAAYEVIRAAKRTDIAIVAKNTGLTEIEILTLKKHLFYGTHSLPVEGVGTFSRSRFTAVDETAYVWQAAQAGPLNAAQRSWFRKFADHELAERG